tara:strand:+ start:1220 stop:1552 length:333 start_codon:yes stop_codon:yes gene_type:complete
LIPEEALIISVITRAILDSIGDVNPVYGFNKKDIQQSAKNWINSNEFNKMCVLVELNPGYIKKLHEKVKKYYERNLKKSKEERTNERLSKLLFSRISKLRSIDTHFSYIR